MSESGCEKVTTRSRAKLRQTAYLRFPNDQRAQGLYIHEVEKLSISVDDESYTLCEKDFYNLRKKYGRRPVLVGDTSPQALAAAAQREREIRKELGRPEVTFPDDYEVMNEEEKQSWWSGLSNMAKRSAHGAKSVVKTSMGIDLASKEQQAARLEVCRNCPGNHAVWWAHEEIKLENGKKRKKQVKVSPRTVEERNRYRDDGKSQVYTCGPMLESLKAENKPTCGCVLDKKVRDIKEDCPNGYWPKIEVTVKGEKVE